MAKKELCAFLWTEKSYVVFSYSGNEMLSSSSLHVEATEVSKMRFKVKVCSDTASSTEISRCSHSEEQ